MRRRGLLLLIGLALAVPVLGAPGGSAAAVGSTSRSAGSDTGVDRPPAGLSPYGKAVWMTEWTACWREKMSRLSSIFHLPIGPGVTPQAAARRISKRAIKDIYETRMELDAGADGCRNGILWRYYHPR
jgi:hypothetical protein